MDNELRKYVISYLNTVETSPLTFFSIDTGRQKKILNSNRTLWDKIERVLELADMCESHRKNSEGDFIYETSHGAIRSSVDIWRHIILQFPDITIFDVMNCLFENKNKLYGNYCHDVKRLVFSLEDGEYFEDEYPYEEDLELLEDEFGLNFLVWKDI